MVFRISITFLLLAWVLALPLSAQEETKEKEETPEAESEAKEETEEEEVEAPLPAGPPVAIVRRTVDNFLTDSVAREPYILGENGIRPMISTFTLDSPDGRYRVVWDPTSCRIAGILDMKPSTAPAGQEGAEAKPASPFLLIAEGVPPLSSAVGGSGDSSYFGFRLVNGHPEFLYEQGQLAVEERVWFGEEPGVLYQHFTVRKLSGPLSIRFPAEWKTRATSVDGEWQDENLTFPATDKHRHLIQYTLDGSQTPGNP